MDIEACLNSLRLNASFDSWLYWEMPVECEGHAHALVEEAARLGLAADWDPARRMLRVRRTGDYQVKKPSGRVVAKPEIRWNPAEDE